MSDSISEHSENESEDVSIDKNRTIETPNDSEDLESVPMAGTLEKTTTNESPTVDMMDDSEEFEPAPAETILEEASTLPALPEQSLHAEHNTYERQSMDLTENQSPVTDNTQEELAAHNKRLTSDIPSTRFAPYQSPLSNLRSFRFNPRFNDTVKDGYRSLTYSNSIDAKEPLCQTELEGQECIDQQCDSQHFRSMTLSGWSHHADPFSNG